MKVLSTMAACLLLAFNVCVYAQNQPAAEAEHVYDQMDGINGPEIVNQVPVAYPSSNSLKHDIDCYVAVVIAADGKLVRIQKIRCVDDSLYQAITESMVKSTYKNATLYNRAVKSRLFLHVTLHKKATTVDVGPVRSASVQDLSHLTFATMPYLNQKHDQSGKDVIVRFIVEKNGLIAVAYAVNEDDPANAQRAVKQVLTIQYAADSINKQNFPCLLETTVNIDHPNPSSQSSNNVEQTTQLNSPPKLLNHIPPEINDIADRTLASGSVIVGLTVDENGVPQDVHVVSSSNPGFTSSAINTVKQYRYKPAMKDGKPVSVQLTVSVNFHIH